MNIWISLIFKDYRVSYDKVGSILLSTEGVQDYDNLRLNDTTGNVTVGAKEIPVLGAVNWRRCVHLNLSSVLPDYYEDNETMQELQWILSDENGQVRKKV